MKTSHVKCGESVIQITSEINVLRMSDFEIPKFNPATLYKKTIEERRELKAAKKDFRLNNPDHSFRKSVKA